MQFAGLKQLWDAVPVVAALAAVGCSNPSASEPGFRLQLRLIGTDTIQSRGEPRTLEALVLSNAGAPIRGTVRFSADDSNIVRIFRMNPQMVSLQSLVDGKARVTASFGDLTESVEVVVRRRVVRFQLLGCGTAESFGLLFAGIAPLNPAVTDSIGHQMPLPAPVTYSSDDTTVVLVNMNGHAMGAGIGRTFISGRLVLPESTFVARCYVWVWPQP